MAGATLLIDATLDDRTIRASLERLLAVNANLRPLFMDIGEYLVSSTKDRFDREEDPSGNRWEELSESTLRRRMLAGVKRARGARRKRLVGGNGSTKDGAIRALAGAKILQDRGYLRDLIRYQTDILSLQVGTDRIYGATHQFGDDSRHIHARPFLGLSEDDRAEVLAIIARYEQGVIDGR